MARELTEQAKTARSKEGAPSLPGEMQPVPVQTELTPQDRPQDPVAGDIDPATVTTDEEDEGRLPEATEDSNEAIAEGPLAIGHAAIENADRKSVV